MSSPSASSGNGGAYVVEPSELILQIGLPEHRAEGLVSQARDQAAAVVREAQSQAQQIRQNAQDQGFQAGCDRAAEEWQAIVKEAAAERDHVVYQLEELNGSLETEVLRLALQLAEKIVRHEVDTKQDTVLDVLRMALRQIRDRANVRIWVNQADLERVRKARSDIAQWVEGLRDVEIGEDRRVDKGGVMIESPDGVLDARISNQLREAERKLFESSEQ